jgi:hypothetical protein
VSGSVGEFEIAIRTKTLNQHLNATQCVRGFNSDEMLSMRKQAEAAGGDRNRESNDECGQAERLIGGRGLRKEITAEQSEEHAAQDKDD